MKRLICLIIVCAVLAGAFCLVSCDEEKGGSSEIAPTEKSEGESQKVLGEYFGQFTEGDDPFIGTWQLEGFEYINYIFRNDNLVEMVMGTEGDFTELQLDKKKKILTVQFSFGLNGAYYYKLSEDNNTISLQSVSDKTQKTKLIRQEDYNLIPETPDNAVIDDALLGWWKNSDDQLCYFGGDGIFYSKNIAFETCYTYNAQDGRITAVYQYGGDITDKLKYAVKGDTLTLDTIKYKKVKKP